MHLSETAKSIEASKTVGLSETAAELNAQGIDVINLAVGTQSSPGDPPTITPEHIRNAAIDSLKNGETYITPGTGLPELRQKLSEKFKEFNGIDADPSNIVVTPGAKYALFESFLALLDAGDRTVLFDPSWVSYQPMLDICRSDTTRITLNPETGFTTEGIDLEEAIPRDAEVLVLNTPLNVSGTVFPLEELERIRDVAIDYDLTVISDEVYEGIVYEGSHHSIGSLDGMDERTITISAFTKSYAMPGWRIGYLTGPSEFIDVVSKIHSNTISTVATFVQKGAISALDGPDEPFDEMRSAFRERRDIMVDAFKTAQIDLVEPHGGMYAFVPIGVEDDVQFCEDLIEDEHIVTVPGSAFGVPGYIRVTFILPPARLRKGVTQLIDYIQSYPK